MVGNMPLWWKGGRWEFGGGFGLILMGGRGRLGWEVLWGGIGFGVVELYC